MIRSAMEKHTVGWLRKRNNEGLLNFTISIQRREVWDLEHKSNLICSVLLGIPIENLLFEEEGEGYKVLDGQQRNLTILKYLNNEYTISDKVKTPILNGVEMVGKKFSDLPQTMQDDLLEYELSISVMRPLNEAERELVFFMRNQAVSLTKFELTRVVMGTRVLNDLKDILEHPFLEKANLSKSALNGYQNQQLVLKCLILEMNKDYSFSSRDEMIFAEELKDNGVPRDTKQAVKDVFSYLNNALPERKKSFKKIHIPMIYQVGKQAMKDKISPASFNQWLELFFSDLTAGLLPKYSEACESGSAKKSSVQTRLHEIENHYANTIGKVLEEGNINARSC